MIEDIGGLKPVKILWTGGWDSTFQLLQLLTVYKKHVTPFYLIDEERRSTGVEILTMKRIKEQLFNRFPYTQKLLYPTQYYAVSDIPSNSGVTEAFERIRNKSFIGGQYDWLARFCVNQNITNLQLCIHKDDKAYAVIRDMVRDSGRDECQLNQRFLDTDEYMLFSYFSFPILSLTKPEMADITRKQKLDDIMGITWFCHNPGKGMKPCGTCNPCLYTTEEGLAWRIPLTRRFLGRLARLIIRPSNNIAKKLFTVLKAYPDKR